MKYETGARFEYLIRDWMRAKGYFVVRSAGSRGAIDLLAFNGKEMVLLQCKREGENSKRTHGDAVSSLEGLQVPPNTLRYLVVRRGKTEVVVRSVPGDEARYFTIRQIRREVKDAGT